MTLGDATARDIHACQQISSLRPCVGHNIVVIQDVPVGIARISPTRYIQVSVDNAVARAAQRLRQVQPRGVVGVGHRVVLPYLRLWRDVGAIEAANQVYLSIEVTAGHLLASARHHQPGVPSIGSEIIVPVGVEHCREASSLHATEEVESVNVGRIYSECFGCVATKRTASATSCGCNIR